MYNKDFLYLGIAGRSMSKLNTSRVEMPGINQSERTSSQLKLERSKTERQKHQNIRAEEAAQIFDDKISVQQKVFLFNNLLL